MGLQRRSFQKRTVQHQDILQGSGWFMQIIPAYMLKVLCNFHLVKPSLFPFIAQTQALGEESCLHNFPEFPGLKLEDPGFYWEGLTYILNKL